MYGVVKEPNRSVGEAEMCPRRMQTPEMKDGAYVPNLVRLELVSRFRTGRNRGGKQVNFRRAEHHVARSGIGLAATSVPPTVLEIRAGWAFTDQQGLTRSVSNLGDADARIGEEDAVVLEEMFTGHTEIARQRDGGFVPLCPLPFPDPAT